MTSTRQRKLRRELVRERSQIVTFDRLERDAGRSTGMPFVGRQRWVLAAMCVTLMLGLAGAAEAQGPDLRRLYDLELSRGRIGRK
jgi:hypothetical protein